jgi:energy-coupling factor transporter ATP-binding protein EcfA2
VVRTSSLEAVFPRGDGVGPVDLTVAPGESVLVLGPSGSGKSTLLRCLTGAVPYAVAATVTGTAEVCGVPVATSSVAVLARRVGTVAQDPQTGVCLPDVADELAFPLENHCADPATIDATIDVALATVQAGGLRERRTTELSGGELQRVALAAAIVTEPALLVLDEPTSMLDAPGVAAVRRAVDEAQRLTGAAVVLVEHRLDEYAGDDGVAGLPGRTLVLDRNGRVVADGPSPEVFARTAADLLSSGCWLPLDAELQAVFGDPRGLDSGPVRTALLATPTPPAPPVARAQVAGEPLALDHVTVAARGPARSARRSRRHPVQGILHDLTFRLDRGELVALVGRNGSGKTTLLSCLAGLQPPTSGALTGPRAGLVFQHPEYQFTQSSVQQEIAFGLPAGRDEQVDAWLHRFGLADFADHNPFQLSGGQQRRLSLAAMLVHDRPFLLADEPGYGLDRHATITAMRALAAAAAAGRGVLFSSHDLRTLCTYADRVLVLGEGRLIADTTPLALLQDEAVLAAAGLRLPRLLAWLRDAGTDETGLQRVLRSLDAHALPEDEPAALALQVPA